MSPICNIMLVYCNPFIGMMIMEDGSNNYDAFTIRAVSIEYNRILQNTQIFSNLHRMSGKYNTMTQMCNLMIVPCNQLLHMVMADDASYDFDALTIRALSSEYNIILQNTQIFSNLHRMGGKYNILTRICNLMIAPCNQLCCMVMVDDTSNMFDDFTLRTDFMGDNNIPSRIHQYSQI
jgi:uncharacterized membrane protein